MKPAYKTTELWLAVSFMVLGFGVLIYAIDKGQELMGVAACIGAISSAVSVQIYGRNRVKEAKE